MLESGRTEEHCFFWEVLFIAVSTLCFKIHAKVAQSLQQPLECLFWIKKSKGMVILFLVLMIHFVFRISQAFYHKFKAEQQTDCYIFSQNLSTMKSV